MESIRTNSMINLIESLRLPAELYPSFCDCNHFDDASGWNEKFSLVKLAVDSKTS